MDIAAALAFVQPTEYWGMNADDIVNIYEYLQGHQGIPGNPYAEWQGMRNMRVHPPWRYYITWVSSCNIQRIQNFLDESLLPIHKQPETSKYVGSVINFVHSPASFSELLLTNDSFTTNNLLP